MAERALRVSGAVGARTYRLEFTMDADLDKLLDWLAAGDATEVRVRDRDS